MIPFFRKIRYRLAKNNQFFKYSRYAVGEIVLVVIGILIALQINNWNTEKSNIKKTNSYLMMLSDEIQSNLKRLEISKNIAIDHKKHGLKTLIKLNSDSAKFIDLNELYALTTRKSSPWKIELMRASFDDLINSGTMENVKDSSLRKQILSIQALMNVHDLQHKEVKIIWNEQIRPYHIEHLNESRIIDTLNLNFTTDSEAFIHNRKYANILVGNIIFIGIYENGIVTTIDDLEFIRKNILNYLDNTQ